MAAIGWISLLNKWQYRNVKLTADRKIEENIERGHHSVEFGLGKVSKVTELNSTLYAITHFRYKLFSKK